MGIQERKKVTILLTSTGSEHHLPKYIKWRWFKNFCCYGVTCFLEFLIQEFLSLSHFCETKTNTAQVHHSQTMAVAAYTWPWRTPGLLAVRRVSSLFLLLVAHSFLPDWTFLPRFKFLREKILRSWNKSKIGWEYENNISEPCWVPTATQNYSVYIFS